MTRVLSALVSRATKLTGIYTATMSRNSASLDAINTVSSLAHVLSIFAARSPVVNGLNSEPFVSAAKTACRGFLTCLEVFPAKAKIPSEVFVRALRCVSRGLSFLPVQTVSFPLLLQIDAHFEPSEMGRWLPGDLLAALYAVAIVKPSLTLAFLPNMLLYLQQHLHKLSGNEVALLLWSLARLGQENDILWEQTCRRCLLLYKRMNAVGRGTVLQTLLLCDHCTCDSQQQLLNVFQNTLSERQGYEEDFPLTLEETEGDAYGQSCRRDAVGVGFPPRSGLGSCGDPLEVVSYQSMRLQLFRSAHAFGVDILLQLLANVWTSGRASQNTKARGLFLSDEVLLLLEHLSHKRLSPAQGVRLLQLLDTHDVFHESSNNELPKLQPIQAAVLRAVGGITEANANAIKKQHETLYALLLFWQVAAVAKPPTSCFFTLSMCFPAHKREELMDRMIELSNKCQEQITAALGRVDGATLWDLVLAASWAQQQQRDSPQRLEPQSLHLQSTAGEELPVKLQRMITRTESVAMACLDSWRQSSGSSLQEECVELIAVGCRTHPALSPLLTASSLGSALLSSCVDLVRSPKKLGWAAVSQLLVALEAVQREGSAMFVPPPTLLTLSDYLVQKLEVASVKPGKTLLRDVETFLYFGTQPQHATAVPWTAANLPIERNSSRVPNALLDLYIRLLLREERTITEQQARVLVQCVESRARCGTGELERAFMLLCTCRFGCSRPFLEAVRIPPAALTRLIELATVLHTSQVPTSITILSALLRVLLEGGVSECVDMSSLNVVASLLMLPLCEDLGVKEKLVEEISRRAIVLSQEKPLQDLKGPAKRHCALEKAYLIAYLVRANAPVSEELLSAFRQSAF